MPGLPVYKCVIDEGLETDLQVEYISLVDKPAIEKTFHAFNQAKLKFAVDEERRIVSGPAMLADMLIYRNDENLGEYYTVFDKQTILSIVQKFFKKGFGQNFNIMHNPDQKTDGVTVYESFITDEARGIKPMKGFEDAADGSWFITAKVYDEAIWQKVKSGEVKGFSVEGIFKQIPVRPEKLTPEQAYAKIKTLLSQVDFEEEDYDYSADFGGPGSGRNPGGGSGSDSEDISSILKTPPEHRTEAQVTKVMKTYDKKMVQGLKGRADRWLRSHKDSPRDSEYRRWQIESTVAGRVLNDLK